MIIVVDVSIVVKWFVNEILTQNAEKLLDGSYVLYAPELILPEFGSVIWKKVRRGEIDSKEGSVIIDAFGKQKIKIMPQHGLLKASYVGAQMSGQSVYDWTYLALAISLSCKFVTADAKFFSALETTPVRKHLLWAGDL